MDGEREPLGPGEAVSAQQRLARRDLRFARWMLPLASAGVLIGSGPLVGIPVAYLSASLLLAMTLDAERQRPEGVTVLLFAVGLAASVVARSLTFPVGWSAIVAGVVTQAAILRRTRGRHVPTADAPFWDPNASSVRSLALMPEPDRRPFELPPTIVVRQRARRFDPRRCPSLRCAGRRSRPWSALLCRAPSCCGACCDRRGGRRAPPDVLAVGATG